MEPPEYVQGSDLPDLAITWRTNSQQIIDFSTGHTFVLKIGAPGQAAAMTKSTGITGAATAPNVTVSWANSGELNTLAPGTHTADLIATRVSDSKQRIYRFELRVTPPIS